MRGSASPAEVARLVADVLEGRHGGSAALATVIERSGSAPQVVGAKLLLLDDGTLVGTVGGGAIEAQVVEACRATLREGRSRRVRAHLVRDLGMCCGGSMEVFVDHLQAQTRLLVFGAGHVAQALVPMAVAAGFSVTVLDDREELLAHPGFADARAEAYDVDELRDAGFSLRASDYVLIVTRDHARDEQALCALLRQPHAYLGMIGSRRKVHAVLRRILHREQQQGRSRPDLSRVHAPIGLDLGGRTPGEIAVSIVAELVARRHAGSGRPMSIVSEIVAEASREPGESG
jgi:xanthine dehydrogenase accessory factor